MGLHTIQQPPLSLWRWGSAEEREGIISDSISFQGQVQFYVPMSRTQRITGKAGWEAGRHVDSLGSWGVLGAHAQKAGVGRQTIFFTALFKRMDCSVQWLLLCYVKTLFTDCLNYNRVYSFCQAGKVATGEEEGRKIRKTTWEKNFSKIIPPPMCTTWGIFLCKVVLGSLKPFELPSATSRLLD